MKILNIIILCFIFNNIALSNTIKLSFETDEGDKAGDLIFGLDKNATLGLDEELGEIFTIDAPPPSGYYIMTLCNFLDSTNVDTLKRGTVWSTKDYIPYPIESNLHIHKFRIWLDGGRKFTMKWVIDGDNIDSAKVQDENGAQFINVDLNKLDSYYWNNDLVPSLNLKLLVWYNAKTTSVLTKQEKINVYPNPANDFIYISSDFKRGEIFNLSGNKLIDFDQKEVNISNLTSGTYFLKLFTNDFVLTKKIIVE